jgi:predicted glycosyltransferase involved in capsule biosynthesis
MKFDLRDTTFVIPVRIDSVIRLENLLLTLDNLESYFDTNIVVIEAAYYSSGILERLIGNNIVHRFVEDRDPVFHRTRHLNTVSKEVNTAFTGIWDADVILNSTQILDAVTQLRNKTCDVSYPYDGSFLDTSDIIRNHYLIHKNIHVLKNNTLKMKLMYSTVSEGNSLGGAFLISTEKYKLSGMENEAFYGWGLEDSERYHRWLILNYTIHRSAGVLFHLSHPRDLNGRMRSGSYEAKAMNELNKTINSTKEELETRFVNDEIK